MTNLEPLFNLGSDGISVRQIMTAMAEVARIDFDPELAPRRPGDPARIVASGDLAACDLDWAHAAPAPIWSPAHGTHTRPQ